MAANDYKTCVSFPQTALAVIEAVRQRYGIKSFSRAVLFIVNEFWQLKGGKL